MNTDYFEFLEWLYATHPALERASYDEQLRARNESLFGAADFYSSNLRKQGYDAWEIHANNPFLQHAWTREHGGRPRKQRLAMLPPMAVVRGARRMLSRGPLRALKPALRRAVPQSSGIDYGILRAQIEYYRPDVLLNHAVGGISGDFLQEVRPSIRLLVGQIASPLPGRKDLSVYDLLISSLPNFVDQFRRRGIAAEVQRLAFEPRILKRISHTRRDVPLSFVGSLSSDHAGRIQLLETLSRRLPLQVWGRGADALAAHSPVRSCHRGPAWGLAMYEILAHSQVTLNHHIEIAGRFANNMRLFEATGVGACLVTDHKDNLAGLFEPEREVVVYQNADECAEKVRYLLAHPEARASIARQGQQRTLREHSYARRMEELVGILQRYLRQPSVRPARLPSPP